MEIEIKLGPLTMQQTATLPTLPTRTPWSPW